jgi:hypothetical protein
MRVLIPPFGESPGEYPDKLLVVANLDFGVEGN